jgi:hypothetical protein
MHRKLINTLWAIKKYNKEKNTIYPQY